MMGAAANNHPVIRVSNLVKDFDQKKVLKDISMQLGKKENLVILGRSGTGKSVLIKCLVRLILPDSGSINVLDQEVLELSDEEMNHLRIRIGYLFQEGALYDSMTLEENLFFPLERNKPELTRGEMLDLVSNTLESVDLLDDRLKMPSELSGGMRKRAGIARTLVLQPEIILYDEPTTGLDPYTSRDINELIMKVRELYKVSAIVVTHDMKCAHRVSDRILLMHQGQFIAEGRYEELENHEDEIVKNYFI